jgi:hypothetical protein
MLTAVLAFVFCLSFTADDFEDIIPNSLRPSEEDVHRMVHFWDMNTEPFDSELEFAPVLPLIEELGNVSFECC